MNKGMYADPGQHAAHNGPPQFAVGQRVMAHPGTNAWMIGDRYGTVERVGVTLVRVRMDKSGRLLAFHPANVEVMP